MHTGDGRGGRSLAHAGRVAGSQQPSRCRFSRRPSQALPTQYAQRSASDLEHTRPTLPFLASTVVTSPPDTAHACDSPGVSVNQPTNESFSSAAFRVAEQRLVVLAVHTHGLCPRPHMRSPAIVAVAKAAS